MGGLTPALLAQACRTFLAVAYPNGHGLPRAKQEFVDRTELDSLESLVTPPLGEILRTPEGQHRGYAFRLGSIHYPHVKLQAIINCDTYPCVFAVDTHDALRIPPDHPDAELWTQLQQANRILKERIEQAWEAEGLLTFNAILRLALEKE